MPISGASGTENDKKRAGLMVPARFDTIIIDNPLFVSVATFFYIFSNLRRGLISNKLRTRLSAQNKICRGVRMT